MIVATITNIKKSLDTKNIMEFKLAPITFRTPISLVRCSVVNEVKPNKPRHAIMMVRLENMVNIYPLLSSEANCESKS